VKRPVIRIPASRVQSPSKLKKTAASPIQPSEYPEFAHLKDASPMKSSAQSKTAPRRPSRDGTPDMNFPQNPAVVQSNMTSLPTSGHRRQASSDSRKSIDMKSRLGMARKPPSRNPSPTRGNGARGLTPDPSKETVKSQPSPGPEKSQSRFGFFKRSKTDPPPNAIVKEKKLLRKGPSAGTGHEGYGKFGVRGRSGSTTSGTASLGRSSSADSARADNIRPSSSRKNSTGSKTSSDMDEFVADRLNPITLRGTGPVMNLQDRGSGSTTLTSRSSEDRIRDIQAASPAVLQSGPPSSVFSSAPSFTKASPSPIDSNLRNGDVQHPADPKGGRFGLSSLSPRRAARQSLLDSRSLAPPKGDSQEEIFRFPSHPAIDPLDRKLSEPSIVVGMGQNYSTTSLARRAETDPVNAKTSKKWNFFQRAKTPVKKTGKEAETAPVTIPKQLPPRVVAHYAMMDAPEKIDVFELEKIMLEAEEQADAGAEGEYQRDTATTTTKHGNSILLPAPPPFIPDFASQGRPASPKVMLEDESFKASGYPTIDDSEVEPPPTQLPRGSRLPQVGRIPRVISHRERERKPSISSFSRPFGMAEPSPALQSSMFAPDSAGVSPLTKDERSEDVSPLISSETSICTPGQPSPDPAAFYKLPNQESQGNLDISGLAGMLSRAGATLVPGPHTQIVTDDVWNEYDDLLDSLSPQTPKTPKTPHTGSSLGAPFQYSMLASPVNASYPPDDRLPLPPTPSVPSVQNIVKGFRYPSMRDSQPFLPLGTPGSPASIADFLDRGADRSSTVSGRLSLPSTLRLSSNSNRFSLPASIRAVSSAHKRGQPSVASIPESPPPERKKRDSLMIQKSEVQTLGYGGVANLRFGALMTSKWLSFGRVLFSPAHFELKNPREDRILILDGLGKGQYPPFLT
jgi:hypothetical protein